MLRDDQAATLEKLRVAVGTGKYRIVMQAPTGFGKTVLAAALVEGALSKHKRILFTVPAIDLVDQTIEMFNRQGITEIGVMQASHRMTDWNQPVQIASVQTLNKRTLPEADVVVIDEVHKIFQCYTKWLHEVTNPLWRKVPVIGLSATPWTRGLSKLFEWPPDKPEAEREPCFIRASTTQELIDQGLLSKFVVYAPTHPDLSDIRTVAGDYHEGDLSLRMSDSRLVADAVDTWLRLGENRPTLCYAVDRAHAKHLQMKFQASGVPCGYQDAYTKEADRRQIKLDFHTGALKVVCNVGTLTTGIDWDVRCISMCRPTKSDMLFVQIVGRGLRPAVGKDHCLILDHSDNHTRLGFVTDVDESYTGLLGGKAPVHDNRTANIKLPKECPQCAYLKPPKTAKCPQCGFVAEVKNGIKAEAGELRELKREPKEKAQPELVTEADRMYFYSELKRHAIDRGYDPKWATANYKKKTGDWPTDEMRRVPPAMYVSLRTKRWITSRMIAYFKAKAGLAFNAHQ